MLFGRFLKGPRSNRGCVKPHHLEFHATRDERSRRNVAHTLILTILVPVSMVCRRIRTGIVRCQIIFLHGSCFYETSLIGEIKSRRYDLEETERRKVGAQYVKVTRMGISRCVPEK